MRPLAPCVALALALFACGVEQYRQRAPAPDLSIRLVAAEGADSELVPRLDGGDAVAVARTAVVGAEHIVHVRLLHAADGQRVLVLDLDATGRDRLREASTGHAGERVAIVAGGRVVAAPTIRNELADAEIFVAVPRAIVGRAFDAMTVR